MAKKVDASLLAGLVAGSQGQELNKGVQRTSDSNYPLFKTPVNQNILVYIPRTNVVSDENGETMKTLNTYIHDYKKGKMFGQLRCICGLNHPVFEQLGYDGSCPACDGMSEVWDLYNLKLAAEAKKLGIEVDKDTYNQLESPRKRILGEMDLQGASEYVTFPIVIIPTIGKMQPTPDAESHLRVEFVQWKKKRYNDTILAALDTVIDNPGHPAGMFWMWNFAYDTEGKQATARDSAKNAKYIPVTDGKAITKFEHLISACEVAAKNFTLEKAAEVIISNQFMYKDDLQVEVDKILAKTRQMIELAQAGGLPTNTAGNVGTTGVNLLDGFTGVPNAGTAPMGNLGIPSGTSPIQFGN